MSDLVDTRHVYYSVTEDNPFLPVEYVAQLKRDLDPKTARRMLHGEWIEISAEFIYHQYSREPGGNYRPHEYQYSHKHPVMLQFDFNIGVGKPMSACASQFIDDEFHFAEDFVVEGADTNDLMSEIEERGLFEMPVKFIIHGDASGKNKDTRSKVTDYQIIQARMSKYRRKDGTPLTFEIKVPLANPPVRTRHNTMNGYMLNTHGERRLFVYKKAKTLDEGFRLTKLKPGGQYIEDDAPAYQHVTTAAGYGVIAQTLNAPRKSTSSQR